jgi:diaminopimelate epimerase
MQKIHKFSAAGNDFFISLSSNQFKVREILDRHFGIGADGLIEITRNSEGFEFNLFNADGSSAEISGNGLRAAAHFLVREGLVANDSFSIKTQAGQKSVKILKNDGDYAFIEVHFGQVHFNELYEIRIDDQQLKVFVINTGNPHAVVIGAQNIELNKLRNDVVSLVGKDLNVEKVILQPQGISIEIYERGVGRTLACGSGSVATAKALERLGYNHEVFEIKNPGGTLGVRRQGDEFYLSGPSIYIGAIEPAERYLA